MSRGMRGALRCTLLGGVIVFVSLLTRVVEAADPLRWAGGEVYCKLTVAAQASASLRPELHATGRSGIASLDRTLAGIDATELARPFRPEVNAERKRVAGLDRIYHVRFDRKQDASDVAALLALLPEVEWAEPAFTRRPSVIPNDTFYPNEWGMQNRGQAVKADGDTVGVVDCDLDANQAWDVETGSFAVVVALIDTGIDAGHPEFAGRVASGWDFADNDSDPTDDVGHGTCCAGILAAAGNNGQGVAGVAWGVRILPLKVFDSSSNGNSGLTSQAIIYAADYGAKVLSMSLGSDDPSQVEQDAVNYAFGFDCVMVAASGNDDQNAIEYPAACDHVIAVGALSPCNERKNPSSCDGETNWGSDYGTGLDLLAPGVRITSTDIRGAGGYVNGDYIANFAGTSAATPFVSGVAALVRSRVNLSADQVAFLLFDSCDDLGSPGYDTQTGWGRLNAYVAIRRAMGAVCVGPNAGAENGTYHQPYNTVHEGVSFVPLDNWVLLKPGNYDEVTPWSNINKKLHLDAVDGGVTVR